MGINVPLLYTLSDGSKISYEQLRARVSVLEPGILQLRELPKPTLETLQIFRQMLVQEGQGFERVVHIVDISDSTEFPNAAYREAVVDWMKDTPSDHTCIVQSGFGVVRVALQFMINRAGSGLSIHKSVDEALVKARSFLLQSPPSQRHTWRPRFSLRP